MMLNGTDLPNIEEHFHLHLMIARYDKHLVHRLYEYDYAKYLTSQDSADFSNLRLNRLNYVINLIFESIVIDGVNEYPLIDCVKSTTEINDDRLQSTFSRYLT